MPTTTVPSMYNRYFVYSATEAERMTRIYGKDASPGSVIVKGVPKAYTSIVTDPATMSTDAVVIIKGDIRKIKYTEPKK